MDFFNHWEGDMILYQVFLIYPLLCKVTGLKTVRGCVSLKKYKSQGLSVNSKKENS